MRWPSLTVKPRAVGVGVLPQVHVLELKGQSGRRRQLEAAPQVGVVGGQAQQAGHDAAVGAVPLAGLGKGAVQLDGRLSRLAAQDGACHLAQPHRARRVRAGGADHDRADDVEDGDVAGHGG